MHAIERAADALGRFNDTLMVACRYAIMLIVAALAIILIAAVFWRYVLNSAISWSEEGSKYLMVWLTFRAKVAWNKMEPHCRLSLVMRHS